jgi:ATP-dependent RNA helicase DeaD
MNEFKNLGLSKKITDVLEEMNFISPSEIQKMAIPYIIKGRDVIGTASTGSGKTLAFASGIMESCIPKKGIQALVLTPTRELTIQIAKVIRIFAKYTDLKLAEVYGGVNFDKQIRDARNSEIVIGTPGRILDHLNKKTFDFFDLKILVLDEADRMCDMGFLPDVERIISSCPKKRQTLLFSATTSQNTSYISKKYMSNPLEISVEKYVDPSKLKHYYYDVENHLKFSLLVHLLKKEKSGIVMVFCNTRRNVDLIAMNLKRYGLNSFAIHGGLDQNKRTRIMEQFHKNESKILVCTDVAARGLDIKGVSHVYNYDTPKTSDDYIHRVGRTARAGEVGLAISIITSRDYENFQKVNSNASIIIENKETPRIEILTPKFNQPRDFKLRQNSFSRDNSRKNSGEFNSNNNTTGFRKSDIRNRSSKNKGKSNLRDRHRKVKHKKANYRRSYSR